MDLADELPGIAASASAYRSTSRPGTHTTLTLRHVSPRRLCIQKTYDTLLKGNDLVSPNLPCY